ncbi:MAG: hypothetical protein ACRD3O_12270 [Terriglobia bacterium]
MPNEYQDQIGWSYDLAVWYRQYVGMPCSATIYQTMNILASDPAYPTSGAVVYYSYATHKITMTLDASGAGGGGKITIQKDGTSKSTVF